MSCYRIFIPDWRPALINSLLRSHWRKSARLKKSDAKMIFGYCQNIPKAEKKRIVRLKIFLKGTWKEADPDAYWKSLLDALVNNGLLVDDSAKWVETLTVEFIHHAMTAGTEIMLIDVESAPERLARGAYTDNRVKPCRKRQIILEETYF